MVSEELESLTYKGRSRCFVYKEEDIAKVGSILEEINQFEYRNYMPSKNNIHSICNGEITYQGDQYHWIQLYSGSYSDLTYTGKFQPDLKTLYSKCKEANISIVIVDREND